MTKDEALRLALEAFEEIDGIDTEIECITIDVDDVIKVIKEALAQPEREWVGLTEEEIYLCTNHIDRNSRGWANEYARSIEAKLKQKNGYAEEKNT